MKDYQKELLLLKERKDQLMKTINSHSFSSEKEYNLFVKENINMFVELMKITKEIKDIQWKLMNRGIFYVSAHKTYGSVSH